MKSVKKNPYSQKNKIYSSKSAYYSKNKKKDSCYKEDEKRIFGKKNSNKEIYF